MVNLGIKKGRKKLDKIISELINQIIEMIENSESHSISIDQILNISGERHFEEIMSGLIDRLKENYQIVLKNKKLFFEVQSEKKL